MSRRTVKVLGGVAAVVVVALAVAAIAGATGAFDRGGSLTEQEAKRAEAAALEVTGGGTVSEAERDSENGATYEVEITRSDGVTVDVRLDESFELIVVESDFEEPDGGDDEHSDRAG
jgi:hypothetical protein